jgi:hypothetical protein
MLTRQLAGAVSALVVPLALVTACGGDSDSTAADPADTPSVSATQTSSDGPSDTSSAEPTESEATVPDWPACDSVWTEDGQIPRQYKGCLDGDTAVAADNLSCSSGQRIVRYQDTFFGVAGGTIYRASGPLEKDKQYLKMVRTCRA